MFFYFLFSSVDYIYCCNGFLSRNSFLSFDFPIRTFFSILSLNNVFLCSHHPIKHICNYTELNQVIYAMPTFKNRISLVVNCIMNLQVFKSIRKSLLFYEWITLYTSKLHVQHICLFPRYFPCFTNFSSPLRDYWDKTAFLAFLSFKILPSASPAFCFTESPVTIMVF